MYVQTAGIARSKRSVILVHGIGASGRYFIPLARELEANYSVYIPDLPGYGKTAKPPSALTVEELAQALLSFIDEQKITDPILLGHSMGCQIIAHVNKMRPNFVHILVLISPTVNPNERSVFKQGMRLLQDSLHETFSVKVILFSDYLRMGPLRYIATSRWMVKDKLEKTLSNSIPPTLIIHGSGDCIVPRTWVEYLKQQSPNISSSEIVAAPHALQYKYAREVAKLFNEYIEKRRYLR